MSDEAHQHTPAPGRSIRMDRLGLTQHTCECGTVGSQPAESEYIYWLREDGEYFVSEGVTRLDRP